MLKHSNLLLIVLLFAVVSSTQAQKVAVGFDHAVDFSKYKTYSWTTGALAKNPEIHKQIITMVDEQMSARGLTRKEADADMTISYSASVLNTFDSATVAKPGTWGPGAGSAEAAWLVVKGALILEMKDSSTKSELWRATATDTISNEPIKDPAKETEKASKKVKKALEKMFKYYPPKK